MQGWTYLCNMLHDTEGTLYISVMGKHAHQKILFTEDKLCSKQHSIFTIGV